MVIPVPERFAKIRQLLCLHNILAFYFAMGITRQLQALPEATVYLRFTASYYSLVNWASTFSAARARVFTVASGMPSCSAVSTWV